MRWPLVLTTNYDDLYLAAAHAAGANARRDPELLPFRLLGRSSDDSHRVLMSLRRPDLPVVWQLQGFVGGQAADTVGASACPELHGSGRGGSGET